MLVSSTLACRTTTTITTITSACQERGIIFPPLLSLSLSETRGDGGREREIGTRPGRASTEASSVEKIRGEREQGHFGNHWPPRSGIETGSTIGR